MVVGLLVAMDKEFQVIIKEMMPGVPVDRIIKNHGCRFVYLQVGDSKIILMQSGIGKVNGAIGAVLLISLGADVVISSGVAGGLSKSSVPGQIVVGKEYKYHDVYCGEGNELGQVQGEPSSFYADTTLLGIARGIAQHNTLYGTILTGDCFVDNIEAAQSIHVDFPEACAVDMESCAIAQACHMLEIPFISYRVLSDSILNMTTMSYDNFWEEMPSKMAEYTLSFVKKVIQEYKPF